MEKKELKKYLILASIIIGVCIIVKNLSHIALGIKLVSSTISPLILGCAIAYVFNIFLSFCEKYYFPKRKEGFASYSRRPVCLVLALALTFAFIGLILNIVIPELVTAAKLITSEIPGAAIKVRDFILEYSDEFPEVQATMTEFGIDINSITQNIVDSVNDKMGDLFSSVKSIIDAIGEFTKSIVNFVISLIFAVYLLVRKDKIREDIRRTKNAFLKEKVNIMVSKVFHTANGTFKSFFVGQFLEAIILGSLCMIGMTIFKFPYAAMTGAVVGVTALIPIVGAFIGASVGAFMICTISPIKAFWFIIFVIILQQIEGNIIYPKVVGSSIGLPGIWVLAGVTVGGGLFGIAGMLLGVPTIATVYKFYHEALNEREKKMGIISPPDQEEVKLSKIKIKEKKNKFHFRRNNKK